MQKGAIALKFMLLGLVCACTLTGTGLSVAQTSDEDARRHFEAGASYFETSEYENALREFERSYQLSDSSKRAAILRNIAAVYERMGNLEKTVETLRRYLEEDPNTPDRAKMELRIKNLEEMIANRPVEEPPVEPGADNAVDTAPVPPPKAEPDYTPAYIAWGAGGVATLGAVVTGVIAKKRYDDRKNGCGSTPLGCSDDEVRGVKSMAWVSTALTGVAIVGAGVGTVLYFMAEPTSQEQAVPAMGWRPQVNAGVAPGSAGMEARWTF